jgi:tetratricopeptide (TPR) repeat protein
VLDLPGQQDASSVVQALRDKSLLRVYVPPEATDTLRFDLYLAIRDYAAEKLDDGQRKAAHLRHADYYHDIGSQWGRRLQSTFDVRWGELLRLERENLHAAHARFRETDPARAVRVALALERLLVSCGPSEVLIDLLDSALGPPAAQGIPPGLRAQALAIRGRVHAGRGAMEDAWRDFAAAVDAARRSGEPAALGLALSLFAWGRFAAGQVEDALARATEAAALCAPSSDPVAKRDATTCLAIIQHETRRLDEAEASYRRVLQLTEGRGMEVSLRLGDLLRERGRTLEARALLSQSLATARRANDPLHEGLCVGNLADLDFEAGLLDSARVQYRQSASLLQRIGMRPMTAARRLLLAAVLAELGRFDEAWSELAATRLYVTHVSLRGAVEALELSEAHVALRAAGQRGRDAIVEAEHSARTCLARNDARAAGDSGVRFAASMLRRALGAMAPTDRSTVRPPLVIGSRTDWFTPPGGERVVIATSAPMRHVLGVLVAQRLESPGIPIARDLLLERAWPGERMLASAGAHRVHVAVSKLRKRGLQEILLRRDGGYLLDPSVSVREETTTAA